MPHRHALPKYLQLTELLVREVRSGRLAEGTRLPPERQMAAQHGVSVGTLRKALAELARRGLVEPVQGSGNYIRGGAEDDGVYAFFRVELLSGGGLPTADLLDVQTLPKPPDMPDIGPGRIGHRIRRLRHLSGTPAVLEEIWLDGRFADALPRSVLSESLYLTYRQRLGFWIARAEDWLSLSQVPDWAPEGFGPAPGAPCLMAERMGFANTAAPAEYSRNWIDTSVARYVARLG